MNTKSNNLDTFKTLYLIKGILTLLMSFLPLIYIFLGGFLSTMIEMEEIQDPPPFDIGLIFMIIGVVALIFIVGTGVATILASNYIRDRKNYTFILVVAILNCFSGILGILLGVFTIIEINKPEVKELFEQS
ncbi:MAG: hypothetical protein NXI20_13385 [bacterium]|nr:hypothetical protein [bacterium]